MLGGSGHDDRASATEFDQPLVSKHTQGTKHRIHAHTQDRGQVLGLRDPLARVSFAVRDRAPDLGGDLIMQRRLLSTVDTREKQPVIDA